MIPTTIVITGDRVAGINFVNYAKGQLEILRRQMSLTTPRPLPEGYRTVHPFPGVVVECWAGYGSSVVKIHVSKEFKGFDVKPEDEKNRECIMFLCYTVGYIIGPTEGVDMDTIERRYDVELCKQKRYYIRVNTCNTSDFATYQKGEQVLVSTKWNTQPCCSNALAEGFAGYVVTPLKSNFQRWRDL